MISAQINGLLDELKRSTKIDSGEGTTIGINEIVKKAGVFYEKIRYAIDYREEHTIRRTAIERILSRNLFFGRDANVSEVLLRELIRAGYVENNKILESKAVDVQNIINKFLFIEETVAVSGEARGALRKKIISLAGSEIEMFFFNDVVEEATVNAFYSIVKDRIKLSGVQVDDVTRDIQLFIASRRSLLKSDDETLAYQLWLKFVPNWLSLNTREEVLEVANSFLHISKIIDAHLKDKLAWYLVAKLKNYGIYFSVIQEIVKRYGVESDKIFANEKLLESEVAGILEAKYKKQSSRTRKSAIRAVIYILLTKTVIGLGVEFPYDLFVFEHIYYQALLTNILFHPILLFVMTSFIKPLSKDNTKNAIIGIKSVVYDEQSRNLYIKIKQDRSLLYYVFIVLYTVIFALSFGAVYYVLQSLNFNIVSIGLFIFFLTLVSYFGLRIRYNAKVWKVEVGEERILILLWNFFTLPIVDAGRWLSQKFSTVNIFVFIMDFLIETPFKLVLEVSDAFVSFLKDKKDQIR